MNLHEKIGGTETMENIVQHFYDRVLSDEKVNHFFAQTDMNTQLEHQRNFLTVALGGQADYKGRSMKEAHQHMGAESHHFDAVMGHLKEALQTHQIDEADVEQVMSRVTHYKDQIVKH